jgi:formamidopyrimidine-DNA glycosylase
MPKLPIIEFICKLDIFPLMCAADKVWITELTLNHKNIRSVRNSHCARTDSDIENFYVNNKNNNASFEDLDIYYHSSSCQTCWILAILSV